MDLSVSGKDEIWFLCVCHHVPHELYHVEEHHVAGAEDESNCTADQSVLATICRNFRKGGALQLAMNMYFASW